MHRNNYFHYNKLHGGNSMLEKENLGINDYDFIYYELSPEQDFLEEIVKINNFLNLDFPMYLEKNYPNYYSKDMKIKFINWGHMEVIYVLDNGQRKYTLVMGQPSLEYGKVKSEYDNLKILSKNNEDVVSPLLYYGSPKYNREIYMTPYYYQARCISYLDEKLGVYVPEPDYHFEEFNGYKKDIIEEAITAKIISLYNLGTHVGINDFSISSGDFILERGFEDTINNVNSVFNDMKVIAARSLVNMSLDDYIDLIYEKLEKFNSKNINKGIELGFSKIKKRT